MEAVKAIDKKNSLAPQLRFKGFTDEWINTKLKDLTNLITKGTTPQSFSNQGINYVKIEGLVGVKINKEKCLYIDEVTHNRELRRSILQNNDLLFAIAGATIGKVAIVTEDILPANTNQALAIIRLKNIKNLKYVLQILQSRIMKKYIKDSISVGAQPNLNLEQMGDFRFHLPTLPEQQKIASFLSAIDEKIQQLTRKKELLEQYKKGVMQQLFSGKLRFKDKNGKAFPKWDEKLLGDMAERNSTKNRDNNVNFVLTNSATQGIVSQDDYFDRKIANQNNLEGYYIVEVDDFVYNPRISVHAPVGPIKRNKLRKGVMSPLYSIFRFKEKNLEYFEYYFETKEWHTYLESVSNIGARHDRMNIANSDFFKMPIPFPCLEERNKITYFLKGLSLKIESINKLLTQTQAFKKGLLQQMFV